MIITDNDMQFIGNAFLELYDEYHIRVDWVVLAHPHENGQVERAKDMILQGLNPRAFVYLKQVDDSGPRN